MDSRSGPDISRLFEEVTPIERALRRAVREALRQHKRAGNPIAEWQDGKVVWIQPEDLDIPDDE